MPTREQLELAAEAALEIKRRRLVKRASDSLYVFNNEVLGYKDMAEQPHREMCDSVQFGGLHQLKLYPRGHFKSSMITVGYTLKCIVENPNIRILIANVTLGNAKSFLREIKGHMERNEVFRDTYGELVSDATKWTETEIIVATRTKNLKEPTIMVAGVGQSLTGMHFDLIIGDDLVNYDTVNTMEQIQKTYRWYGDAQSLLEPGGQEILIGTRYHYADIYGTLIESMSDVYRPTVHSAFLPDGSPLFPSRFTTELLAEIKRKQGSYLFSCQYMNMPVDDEHAKFKQANIQYYKPDTLIGKSLFTTMTVDRAYSLAKTADFTGITIRSMDADRNWYIRYAKRHKQSEREIINSIFNLYEHYNVRVLGIEQNAFKWTFKNALDEEMRKRGQYINVIELRGKASKIARIEGLVPVVEANSLYLIQGEMTDLEDEMLRFPKAEHDDVLDALAFHLVPELMAPDLHETKNDDPPEGSFEYIARMQDMRREAEYDY